MRPVGFPQCILFNLQYYLFLLFMRLTRQQKMFDIFTKAQNLQSTPKEITKNQRNRQVQHYENEKKNTTSFVFVCFGSTQPSLLARKALLTCYTERRKTKGLGSAIDALSDALMKGGGGVWSQMTTAGNGGPLLICSSTYRSVCQKFSSN